MRNHRWLLVTLTLLLLTLPQTGAAFCGFYVAGADAALYNDATQVVLLRSGQRTVLSMQNNYRGPVADFAMVVPVPTVLKEEEVKTLPKEIFARVDSLAAPRLVEYWEQDPCAPMLESVMMRRSAVPAMAKGSSGGGRHSDLGVTIEAEFTVGEYDIVILSAKDSSGLETWLKRNRYRIPEGAEPVLRPYVASGMKFFVAKVNAKKVKFDKDGQALLSPLRFHYDSEEFSLPVRLGMVNSAGTQDLIIHILSPGDRYEVANYKNVTIPTNLDVKDGVRERFGEFYASLFDETRKQNPSAVITEYAWNSDSCDPCPTPPLSPPELATLGMDVIAEQKPQGTMNRRIGPGFMPIQYGMVLTRLHARYEKGSIEDDLRFAVAKPIVGGREMMNEEGKLEQSSQSASMNNFQARYAIRHPWTGAITCDKPVRDRWGGPPNGEAAKPQPRAATNLGGAPRGQLALRSAVTGEIPGLILAPEKAGEDGLSAKPTGAPTPADPALNAHPEASAAEDADLLPANRETGANANANAKEAGCQLAGGTEAGAGFWAILGALLWLRRTRHRRTRGA